MMVFYPALSITNEKWYHTAHEESFEHAKILRSQHQCHPCLLRWMELGNSCSLQDHGLVSAVWLSMFSRVLCHETFWKGSTLFHHVSPSIPDRSCKDPWKLIFLFACAKKDVPIHVLAGLRRAHLPWPWPMAQWGAEGRHVLRLPRSGMASRGSWFSNWWERVTAGNW